MTYSPSAASHGVHSSLSLIWGIISVCFNMPIIVAELGWGGGGLDFSGGQSVWCRLADWPLSHGSAAPQGGDMDRTHVVLDAKDMSLVLISVRYHIFSAILNGTLIKPNE